MNIKTEHLYYINYIIQLYQILTNIIVLFKYSTIKFKLQ